MSPTSSEKVSLPGWRRLRAEQQKPINKNKTRAAISPLRLLVVVDGVGDEPRGALLQGAADELQGESRRQLLAGWEGHE